MRRDNKKNNDEPLAYKTICREEVIHNKTMPRIRDGKTKGVKVELRWENNIKKPNLNGPKNRTRLLNFNWGRILYTQNWKGAYPNFRRIESWIRMWVKGPESVPSKNKRLEIREATKNKERAEELTWPLSQPTKERVERIIQNHDRTEEEKETRPSEESQMPTTITVRKTGILEHSR